MSFFQPRSHEHICHVGWSHCGSVHDGSNLPQLKKAWTTGQTGDISLNMLLVLVSSLVLWVAYGLLKEDIVVILANGISLTLIGGLLYLKMKQSRL